MRRHHWLNLHQLSLDAQARTGLLTAQQLSSAGFCGGLEGAAALGPPQTGDTPQVFETFVLCIGGTR
jgi:hypothetical protein